MHNEKQQAAAAAKFAERWKGKGYEKGESQLFWTELLTDIYGIENPSEFIRYEEQVKVEKTNFIDGHIPSTRVLIEQKSINKDLRAPVPQSDGGKLTPYQQAKRYIANMPLSQHPRWVVTCNFAEFYVYDMEFPNGEPEHIYLKDLGKEYYRLQFLVDANSEHITKEMRVSMQAGEIVGCIYDALLRQYGDNTDETLRWLNILCVRIVFCLYAEDAHIFRHDQFHDFLAGYNANDLRQALRDLFLVLNTPLEKRSRYLKEDLKAFPYTNGGLFEEEIEIPQFTEEVRQTLLQNASLDFDWSDISPTIFGAVFESTLNPETRRSGGMHYTSIENIHKVIDPLFLNDLRQELDLVLAEKVEKQRQRKLDEYQDKLASLTFLDPACGSGNFLTETYLSLRRLENEAIRERYHGQMMMGDFKNPVKVSINQFYGIEINDFAVTVATTALWISESQMLAETERIIQHDIDFLPLKSYANIREGNALRMDWSTLKENVSQPYLYTKKLNVFEVEKISDDVVSASSEAHEPAAQYNKVYDELTVITEKVENKQLPLEQDQQPVVYDYIMGNPPFVGARMMSKEQKDDVLMLFGNLKNVGNLDYVSCWYKKAADYILGKPTKAALVSTNSITQGAQVAILWKNLFAQGIHIDFAWRTFRWDSESESKAHVHCVIVGFSVDNAEKPKMLFIDDQQHIVANNINGYLLDAPNVFIESRPKPLCNVPPLLTGSQRIDNDEFMFTDEEKVVFVKEEPLAEKYFRRWYGADEFLYNRPRWCLNLGDCLPSELRKMKKCMEIVEAVKQYRLSSKREATVKAALYPSRFGLEVIPTTNFMIIPVVSSEKRTYIPIGFMTPNNLCSNQVNLIPDSTLYEFGVLMSSVHMAWVKAVCGRLKSDFRYSKDIVYNNFPWPNPTDVQKTKIESTAKKILEVRAKYPTETLADLYDDSVMLPDLRQAHQANDRAVMVAYGFDPKMTESQIVAELFRLYKELIPIEHGK
jgi:type I restriction-modification system DNA methylase subunit